MRKMLCSRKIVSPPSLPPSSLPTCVLVSSINEPSISFFSACSRPSSFSPAANVSGPRPFTLEEKASRSTSGT